MVPVGDPDLGRLDLRMADEPGSHELAVERPRRLGVGSAVHAGEPPAAAQVRGEGRPLGVAQHLAAGVEEDDRAHVAQPVDREVAGVLGGPDGRAVVPCQLGERRDAGPDALVAVPGGAGEDEDPHHGTTIVPAMVRLRPRNSATGSAPVSVRRRTVTS